MNILQPLPSLSGAQPTSETTVTVLVNFSVAHSDKVSYLDALRRLLQRFDDFPGTIGCKVFQHDEPEAVRITIVQRFAAEKNYTAWLASEAFDLWQQDISKIDHKLERVHRYSGMEALFAAGKADAPPRWKMCVVLFLAVFPLSLILSTWFGKALASIPPLTGALITAPIMVTLMTYLMVPILTKIFANWLQPSTRSRTMR